MSSCTKLSMSLVIAAIVACAIKNASADDNDMMSEKMLDEAESQAEPAVCTTSCILNRVRRRIALLEDDDDFTLKYLRTLTDEDDAINQYVRWNWERLKAENRNDSSFLSPRVTNIASSSLQGQLPQCKVSRVIVSRNKNVESCIRTADFDKHPLPMEGWQSFGSFVALRFQAGQPGPTRKLYACFSHGHRYRNVRDTFERTITFRWTFSNETSDVYCTC